MERDWIQAEGLIETPERITHWEQVKVPGGVENIEEAD